MIICGIDLFLKTLLLSLLLLVSNLVYWLMAQAKCINELSDEFPETDSLTEQDLSAVKVLTVILNLIISLNMKTS